MKPTSFAFALLLLGSLVLTGCGAGQESNSSPAGPEANSGKKYTPEDAAAAQPKRHGSGDK